MYSGSLYIWEGLADDEVNYRKLSVGHDLGTPHPQSVSSALSSQANHFLREPHSLESESLVEFLQGLGIGAKSQR